MAQQQALANPDPYYYMRGVQQGDTQRMALGQRGGYTSQEITNMIGANFEAQQQNEITQRELRMKEQQVQMQSDAMKFQKQQAKEAQTAQMWGGIGKAAAGILGQFLGGGKGEGGSNVLGGLGGLFGDVAGGLGGAASSAWDTVSSWFGGGSGGDTFGSDSNISRGSGNTFDAGGGFIGNAPSGLSSDWGW